VTGTGQDTGQETDDGYHRQLTTLAGWRAFVEETSAAPQLLTEHAWKQLGEHDGLAYDERRLHHHARLLVVATPTIRRRRTDNHTARIQQPVRLEQFPGRLQRPSPRHHQRRQLTRRITLVDHEPGTLSTPPPRR
jgi:hypothetical protein